MTIETIKKDIESYLSNVIDPIYNSFEQTKDKKVIKDLDEKLEVLQSKIDVLYEMDEVEGDDFYMRKIGTLPPKDVLIGG